MSNTGDTRETHPSYGMAVLCRTQGGIGPLFGSPLPNHNSCITMYVRRGSVVHDLSEDRYSAAGMDHLIEIRFSAAQFAELITCMGVGDGVPCTLGSLGGESIPRPRHIVPEHKKITDGFSSKISDLVERVKAVHKETQLRFEDRKPISVKERDALLNELGRIVMELESNAPFVLEQFGESAQRIVTSAKAEIAAAAGLMMPGLKESQMIDSSAAAATRALGEAE